MNRRSDSKMPLARRQLFWEDVDKGEMLDPTPVELPADAEVPETAEEMMKRFVREQLSEMAVKLGMDSFEEADDFEPEDENDFDEEEDLSDEISRYSVVEMQREGDPGALREDGAPVDEAILEEGDRGAHTGSGAEVLRRGDDKSDTSSGDSSSEVPGEEASVAGGTVL